MKYIKLVASDLDGTLLDKNKEITPRLYHALEQMNEQGIYFVPARNILSMARRILRKASMKIFPPMG